MKIVDRQVRSALETIVAELESSEIEIATLRDQLQSLEYTLDAKDEEIAQLMSDIEELTAEVKRLDDALADTYVSQLDEAMRTQE